MVTKSNGQSKLIEAYGLNSKSSYTQVQLKRRGLTEHVNV